MLKIRLPLKKNYNYYSVDRVLRLSLNMLVGYRSCFEGIAYRQFQRCFRKKKNNGFSSIRKYSNSPSNEHLFFLQSLHEIHCIRKTVSHGTTAEIS